jgi:dienelactone hydrolase
MMLVRLALLFFLAYTSLHAQSPASGDAVAMARATLERLTKGDFAGVVATFDEKVAEALPEATLRATWQAIQGKFGAVRATGQPRTGSKSGLQIVAMLVEFERAQLEMQVVLDSQGRIAGLGFRPPPSTTPFADAPYVSPATFSEREITVDAGGWPLAATLSVPNGEGPFPAVVLVHGSGPGDRDQSLGPNKPFRDLARGLASRGVAILRYEKRTRVHASKMAALPNITVNEESVDDTVAAVRLLRSQPGIDPKRVFVAGHSLGGTLAPRIARAAGSDLAGLIIMAGAVRSLPQLLIDQSRYLAQADGKITPEEQKQLDQLQRLSEQVRDLKPGDAPPSIPGTAVPTSYWIDLRDYDMLGAAATVKVPMLLIQGGRDYQVTTEDFETWKKALAQRRDVTFKAYPSLNHLLIPGTGPSLPAEYMTAGHVDEQVIRDIAEWIRAIG